MWQDLQVMDGVENVVLDTVARPAPLSVAADGRAATCGKKAGWTTAQQQRVPSQQRLVVWQVGYLRQVGWAGTHTSSQHRAAGLEVDC
jgi:hypothetical protein